MSSGASLPHKATIGSGSEQPGRYYSPNPAPIIQTRESERHRERGRAEDEVIPNSATPRVTASLQRDRDKERDGAGDEGGLQSRAAEKRLAEDQEQEMLTIGEWTGEEVKTTMTGA